MNIARINCTPDWDAPEDWSTIRDRVLTYLNSGEMVIQVMATGEDHHDPHGPADVPLGFKTDGTWMWSLEIAYYLDTYDQPIDPDFLGYMRRHGFNPPQTDANMVNAALAQLDELGQQYADKDVYG